MNDAVNQLHDRIRSILIEARRRSFQAVNAAMVETYWQIGRMLIEDEQGGNIRAEYGKKALVYLSDRLTKEFGEGFDERNLPFMRQFYLAFPIWNAVRSELTWTHYRLISKIDNERTRHFYRDEAIASQWSTRQLARQIHSFYYQRLLSSQQKTELIAETNALEPILTPQDIIKDPYVLEFLGLHAVPKLTEKELETALIDKLQAFLLELGKGFAFVGRQKRIPTDNKNFYIDLVFYNILLKCYVLIDLKIGELNHADIGQMDMYVRYYEDKMRGADDNPTVGIILCSEKDAAVVKYSVLEDNKFLFASKYTLYLPTEAELATELKREMDAIRMEKQLNIE